MGYSIKTILIVLIHLNWITADNNSLKVCESKDSFITNDNTSYVGFIQITGNVVATTEELFENNREVIVVINNTDNAGVNVTCAYFESGVNVRNKTSELWKNEDDRVTEKSVECPKTPCHVIIVEIIYPIDDFNVTIKP